MNVSESWLRTWANPKVSREELLHRLTMAGLEVDGVEPVSAAFSGVIVGEIVACEPHPDADKLHVTRVSIGCDEVQVVCGAPNARVGLKAPFATVGAVLPGDFKIKKAKLRGVESLGMLCAEEELGTALSDTDGLMELPSDAPVGMDIREYLDLDDVVAEISLTPNRADCLSLAGLAREVSANYQVPVCAPEISDVEPKSDRVFSVKVEAREACPRFVGRVIEGVNVEADTPLWMKQRLLRSGVRPLDPVVDVTNYVMLELGQPMHGYDLDLLNEGICVRYATQDEKVTLLDGSEHILTSDTLLIADQKKALGLAGIMGGKDSGINAKTQHIFLESAFFAPALLAGKARSYGLHTDASHRFERGVDSQLQRKAVERATALILSICGGEAGPVTEVVSGQFIPDMPQVKLRQEKVASLLGMSIDSSIIEPILLNLGLACKAVSESEWLVDVPSWRFDIAIEEDLIEEIGRIYGYDKLPVSSVPNQMNVVSIPEASASLSEIRQVLVSCGYSEAVNFSLVDPVWQEAFYPDLKPVQLQNPISNDMSVMRTSLLPGLVKALAYNQKRQQSRIRLFEEGQRFIQQFDYIEQTHWVSAVIFGSQLPEGWTSEGKPCDFYDMKGDLEALLDVSGASFTFEQGTHKALHPGQTAAVLKQEKIVGHIGAVHPGILKKLSVKGPVYAFEIEKEALLDGDVIQFESLSKYPEVRRDIAIIVANQITCEQVMSIVRTESGEWLTDVRLFDVYSGKGIEDGQKSFALGLTWRHPSRTLKDNEISDLFDNLVTALGNGVKATLRK